MTTYEEVKQRVRTYHWTKTEEELLWDARKARVVSELRLWVARYHWTRSKSRINKVTERMTELRETTR